MICIHDYLQIKYKIVMANCMITQTDLLPLNELDMLLQSVTECENPLLEYFLGNLFNMATSLLCQITRWQFIGAVCGVSK